MNALTVSYIVAEESPAEMGDFGQSVDVLGGLLEAEVGILSV